MITYILAYKDSNPQPLCISVKAQFDRRPHTNENKDNMTPRTIIGCRKAMMLSESSIPLLWWCRTYSRELST